MFNIGMMEFIVIAALALIFIGPKQLPEVARFVGRFLNELKRAGEEAFGSVNDVRSRAKRLLDDPIRDEFPAPPEPVLHHPVKPDVTASKTESPSSSAEQPKSSSGESTDG